MDRDGTRSIRTPPHTEADREWFAGNITGAVERYGELLDEGGEARRARAALLLIGWLLDEIASVDGEFRRARMSLRARIVHLLVGPRWGAPAQSRPPHGAQESRIVQSGLSGTSTR
jgi:hypothetical protein